LTLIQLVRVEIGPVIQKRVLLPIDVVPVFPADGIKAAMGTLPHGRYAFQHDVAGKDGIDVIKFVRIYNVLKIKVKIVLQSMDARICPGGPCEAELLPEKGLQGLLYLRLY
jgi:hypothetical protein